jgi:hypothetical protein
MDKIYSNNHKYEKKTSFSFLLAEGISFLTTLSELEALRCPLSTFSINILSLRD